MRSVTPFLPAAILAVFLLSGCAIHPLGPLDKAPEHKAAALKEYAPFAWGISTSSLQYENKGVAPGTPEYFVRDWDLLVNQGKAPVVGNALYSWSDFDKDVAALKKIGVTHYRFSIEWARVEPETGRYNEKAIRGYVTMCRKLKEAGIEPVVTLWHFTFPAWLTDPKDSSRTNWLNPIARSHWNLYVERIARATAPYVKYYAPENEPNGQVLTAYIAGLWPPCHTLDFKGYRAATTASAEFFRDAARIIKCVKPSAKVVSVEALPWWKKSPLDPGGVFYNTVMHANFDHLDRIHDVCDIIGFNYYYGQYAGPLSFLTEGDRHGRNFSMMGWSIDPGDLGRQIALVGKRYDKPMMITENGIATKDEAKHIRYISEHLEVVRDMMGRGYDVRGYFVWSLADNYEWHYGYVPKFGLCTMDPVTKVRVPKASAGYYAGVIRSSQKAGAIVPDPARSTSP
jgi:beta-glucosidase